MRTTRSRRCPTCGTTCTLFERDVCAGCFRASQGKLPEARIVAGPEANDSSEETIEAAKERLRQEREAGRKGTTHPEPREPRVVSVRVFEETDET